MQKIKNLIKNNKIGAIIGLLYGVYGGFIFVNKLIILFYGDFTSILSGLSNLPLQLAVHIPSVLTSWAFLYTAVAPTSKLLEVFTFGEDVAYTLLLLLNGLLWVCIGALIETLIRKMRNRKIHQKSMYN